MSRADVREALDAAIMRARRAEWLRQRLDALPLAYVGAMLEERIANRRAYDQALADLRADIAAMQDRPRLTDTGTQARVTMLGLTSTSTGGLAAALRNWITRATT